MTGRAPAAGRPTRPDLPTVVGVAFPGWRAWRAPGGGLAARKGGSPPPGPHARGGSPAELLAAIGTVITTGLPPALDPDERAALGTLTTATAPLTVRAVSDATGQHLAATAKALTTLLGRGMVTRHRDGRAWFYTPADTASPGEEPPR